MLPTTPEFYCFLAVIFLAFWLLRRNRAASLILICAANLFFYARSGPIYLILIPAAATCDFLIARALGKTPSTTARKLLIAASVAMNVGLIISSKYIPLLTGGHGFILPLSLSFYAFQAMTYTIDIYRKDTKPTLSFPQYFASVTFFPTTLAGPITRVSSLLPQWTRNNIALAGEEGSRALFLIGLGLFKKFMIADYLGINLVNRVFDLPTLYSGGDVLVAVYAYAFQLYYDFSGYTDIAIGSALLLGIRLPINFNAPYSAANIADFWKRWHISFSKWLQEYLYFSLPGPRTKVMPYVNLIITMAIGGLWHGAGWNYLIWGLIHGTGLAGYRLWQTLRKGRSAPSRIGSIAGSFVTFHFVLFAWIFFRAADFDLALRILAQIGALHFTFENTTPAFLAVLAIGIAGHYIPKAWYDSGMIAFARTPAVLQAAALALLVVAIQHLANSGAAPFIYSRF